MEFFKRILSIFYPNRCPYCGKVIVADEKICNDCVENLPHIIGPFCECCGSSKEHCKCKGKQMSYKMVIAPFYYDGVVKNAIKQMKFSDKPYIAQTLSDYMSDCISKRCADVSFDIITCVPMSKKELRARGFNQSNLLAKGLKVKENPIIDTGLLLKLYNVAPQHSLGANQRKANVLGIFDVAQGKDVKGKTILLCDDVKTTGATANECASILLLAGAKEVYLICASIANKSDRKY